LHEHNHDHKYDGGLPVPASGILSIVAGGLHLHLLRPANV
jgi:hypothetical protein